MPLPLPSKPDGKESWGSAIWYEFCGAPCVPGGVPSPSVMGSIRGTGGRVWEKKESKEVGKGETGGSRGERRA